MVNVRHIIDSKGFLMEVINMDKSHYGQMVKNKNYKSSNYLVIIAYLAYNSFNVFCPLQTVKLS